MVKVWKHWMKINIYLNQVLYFILCQPTFLLMSADNFLPPTNNWKLSTINFLMELLFCKILFNSCSILKMYSFMNLFNSCSILKIYSFMNLFNSCSILEIYSFMNLFNSFSILEIYSFMNLLNSCNILEIYSFVNLLNSCNIL